MLAPEIAPPPAALAVVHARRAVEGVPDWRPLHPLIPGIGGPRPDPGQDPSYYQPTRVGGMGPDDFRKFLDDHRAAHADSWQAPGPAVLTSRIPVPGLEWSVVNITTIQAPGSRPETYIVVQDAADRPFGT